MQRGRQQAFLQKNKVTAAPVTLSKGVIDTHHRLSGLIVNSGNANAFTGDDAFWMLWRWHPYLPRILVLKLTRLQLPRQE
ncbi:bifunctional ornithine acetyltransferase/N-acetylglutamate synthase [Methanosarcina barkeri]|uniref:bifunctional ornithine acetyltransferase/N-acetylglutamate synthase n=1 Tax=Methanosarcina barkeri TaxID=2208 RepID=UPI00373FC85C